MVSKKVNFQKSYQNTVQRAFDAIKKNMPNFTVRFAQNKMIAEIAKTLSGEGEKNIICIEAPTGVGKTLAYLISAIIVAKMLKKRLIISSATIALQEQLIHKDLADISKYSLLDFDYGLVKGRNRYVCLRNLNYLANDRYQDTLFNTLSENEKISKTQQKTLMRLEKKYQNKTWDGEYDTLNKPPDKKLWMYIQAKHYTCSAKACDFYQNCCFFNTRKQLYHKEVLVANHDLVLTDLIRTTNAFGKPEDNIYIFDEAHHLAAKARHHFAYYINLNTIENELGKIAKLITDMVQYSGERNTHIGEFNAKLSQLSTSKNELFYALEKRIFEENIALFNLGVIDKEYRLLNERLYAHVQTLFDIFESCNVYFLEHARAQKSKAGILEAIKIRIGLANNYKMDLCALFDNTLKNDKKTDMPMSRWVERVANKKTYDYLLHVAKIDIAPDLKKLLWSKCCAALLTSATLTTLGNFERFNTQLGLDEDISRYLRLASPFAYKADFIIPNLKLMPHHPDYLNTLSKELIARLNNKTGTLVLFTARKQMHSVARFIVNKIDCSLLCQDEYAKHVILKKYKALRDKGKGCVIFGLDSFYEGIDLRGDYLTHIMITKLRFNVPTSPLEKTMAHYLESRGRNAFLEISLPDAALKLIQACGRLIRSENDYGKITLFDRRIVEKFYGKKLLMHLDNFNIIIEP